MSVLLVVLSFLVIFITYYFWTWYKLRSSLPNGPPPLPIIGNLHQIDDKDPRKTIMSWHKKYGPVFTVWMGPEPQIFVTGYKIMKEIFVTNGNLFADRQRSYIFELLTGNSGIINSNGESWVEQRRFALQTLRNFGFGSALMEERIQENAEKLVETISTRVSNPETAVFDIQNDIVWCLGNIIASLTIGKTYSNDDKNLMFKFRQALDNIIVVFSSTPVLLLNYFPFLRFVPLFDNFGFKVITDNEKVLFDELKKEVALHKKHFSSSEDPTDFTTAYLHEMDKREKSGKKGYFSEEQLLCVLHDLILPGIEDPVKALHWAVMLMTKYPEVQNKVQAEIQTIVGDNRFVSLADRSKLPYTNAVIHEVQRFANNFPFNLLRVVKETVTIGGYTLPQGVGVVPQISAVHYDETIFENPLEFSPERFLEKDRNGFKKIEEVIPFSVGKRSCMGESMARAELFLVFASLLQKFKFSTPPNEPEPSLTPVPGLTLSPQPFKCFVQLRSV